VVNEKDHAGTENTRDPVVFFEEKNDLAKKPRESTRAAEKKLRVPNKGREGEGREKNKKGAWRRAAQENVVDAYIRQDARQLRREKRAMTVVGGKKQRLWLRISGGEKVLLGIEREGRRYRLDTPIPRGDRNAGEEGHESRTFDQGKKERLECPARDTVRRERRRKASRL